LTALVNELRHPDVTTLLTEETEKLFGPEVELAGGWPPPRIKGRPPRR
jgi:hypothetical protein